MGLTPRGEGLVELQHYLEPIIESVQDGGGRDLPILAYYDTDRAVPNMSPRKRNYRRIRLKKARKVVWEKLENDWMDRLDDGADDETCAAALDEYASVYLLPDAAGQLSEFFTTCRSFFGDIGDRLLSMNEIDWV